MAVSSGRGNRSVPSVRLGCALPGDVVAAARHAEDLGFESVWAVDQLVAGTGVPLIDSMIALSAVAGATDRVKLGLGVMIIPIHLRLPRSPRAVMAGLCAATVELPRWQP
jgi:alkanesulfonate monooxygenase SsuD/methylene tetrahydromethanopterin reductase-like flavin-dependent oxidoreductase (luciferase family)